jgi:hypothetical protein
MCFIRNINNHLLGSFWKHLRFNSYFNYWICTNLCSNFRNWSYFLYFSIHLESNFKYWSQHLGIIHWNHHYYSNFINNSRFNNNSNNLEPNFEYLCHISSNLHNQNCHRQKRLEHNLKFHRSYRSLFMLITLICFINNPLHWNSLRSHTSRFMGHPFYLGWNLEFRIEHILLLSNLLHQLVLLQLPTSYNWRNHFLNNCILGQL